jgi:hypothetical protein
MTDRAVTPRPDPIPWLLEGDDPSVCFFTLTELLGAAPDDPEVVAARRALMSQDAVKALKALSAIPADRRSPEVDRTLAAGAEFMLRHHVHRRSRDLAHDSKPGWRRLGFPLMYQTDVLAILGILTGLGYRDERMREALDLVAGKADAQSRWKLQDTFNDRFVVPIEVKGEPSRWITLRALEVLGAA